MLLQRVLTALIFAPALLGVIWVGGVWLELACAGLAALMAWEFFQMALGPRRYFIKLLGFALTAALVAALLGWMTGSVLHLLAPVSVFLLLAALLLRPEPLEEAATRAASLAMGALYAGAMIPHLALIRQFEGDRGLGLAAAAVFCTWGADTGAYFAGRFLGRTKLYPRVSPKKTIEGAVGGIVSATVVAFFIRWLFTMPLEWTHALAFGVIAGVVGIIGDLAESLLKRSYGVKDSSKLIPGHGGVLDRFDAVMFVAPAFFIYATAVVGWTLPQ